MKLELFTVYLKEEGDIKIELNEEVINAYGVDLEEFFNKFETENLCKGVEDFIKALKK